LKKIIGREEMFSQELEIKGSSNGPKDWAVVPMVMDIWDDSLVE
jgi:hypothetical protein